MSGPINQRPLQLLSPAKLNLFLHITGRREDGYHTLQTLFQLLDWGDDILFTPNTSGEIRLTGCDELDIAPQDNLIVRAAQSLQNLAGQSNLGVDIAVTKRIPSGGGLGGGSSNAATALLALNHLWQLNVPQTQLKSMGAALGADVPVFVGGRTAWAEGIGEILSPVDLPKDWFLVVAPPCHVNTGQIFSHQQLTRNSKPIKMAAFFAGGSRNDFQALVRSLYPEVDKTLKALEKFGDARLTGSGACVFVRFDSKAQAEAAYEQLPSHWVSIVAQGVNHSPALEGLT